MIICFTTKFPITKKKNRYIILSPQYIVKRAIWRGNIARGIYSLFKRLSVEVAVAAAMSAICKDRCQQICLQGLAVSPPNMFIRICCFTTKSVHQDWLFHHQRCLPALAVSILNLFHHQICLKGLAVSPPNVSKRIGCFCTKSVHQNWLLHHQICLQGLAVPPPNLSTRIGFCTTKFVYKDYLFHH